MIIGLFVDVNNLYFGLQATYKRKLSYEKYYREVIGDDVMFRAVAYGIGEAVGFQTCLKYCGFEVCYKKRGDWNVQICCDVLSCIGKVDKVVLGSDDPNLYALREAGGDKILSFAAREYSGYESVVIDESLLLDG